jgi:hypothetical protein
MAKLTKAEKLVQDQMLALLEWAADRPKSWHPRIVQKKNRHSSGCDPMVVAEHSAEALSALNRVMG